MYKKLMKSSFVKFVVVWGISTVINYTVFYVLLIFFLINYLYSSAIWYISGLIFWYFFNKLWTFEVKTKHNIEEIGKYLCVYIGSLIISLIVLNILVETAWINPLIANVLVIGLTTVMNYIWIKYLVFNKK